MDIWLIFHNFQLFRRGDEANKYEHLIGLMSFNPESVFRKIRTLPFNWNDLMKTEFQATARKTRVKRPPGKTSKDKFLETVPKTDTGG